MELREYLREEILEEAAIGILTTAERERRLGLFDASPAGAPRPVEPMVVRASNAPAGGEEGDPSVWVGEGASGITTEERTVPAGEVEMTAYVARPAGASGLLPGVIVIHENKGLVEYVKDVARRMAREGFVALAPDLLSRRGGTDSFADPAEATAALGTLDRDEMLADLKAAVTALAATEGVDAGRLGVIGFCFGGGMTWRLLTKDDRLRAGVPFYGPIPPLEDVPAITAPVFAAYGELDERINAGIGDIEQAMKTNGKDFEKEIFTGAAHAFHNDTNPDRYVPEAAKAAWARAIAHFNKHLKAS